MSTFQSSATINKPVNEVYLYLADMNNHKQLMPENILEWVSDVDNASFSIQNMLKLQLRITERIIDLQVKITPAEKPPFDLSVQWVLTSNGAQTNVVLTIDAELNMMMKMMASGPLQKLTDHEVDALKAILG
ncbi:MAG: SRPBCC family protein [Mucilaginibacter sp.]